MIDIVLRDVWEAKPAKTELEPMNHPVEYVIYTHNLDIDKCETDEECKLRMQQLQKREMDLGYEDIRYNFVLAGNGKAYEGRGWWFQPDKSLKHSQHHGNRIDIAYLGNYTRAEELPDDMYIGVHRLVQAGMDFMYIDLDHYVLATDCELPEGCKHIPWQNQPEQKPHH